MNNQRKNEPIDLATTIRIIVMLVLSHSVD